MIRSNDSQTPPRKPPHGGNPSERGGKVRAIHVEKRTKNELQAQVKEHVQAGAAIFTDELLSYDGLESEYDMQLSITR